MEKSNQHTGIIILVASMIGVILMFGLVNPISQNSLYHHFAHDHSFGWINNFWNVISNLGFVLVGLSGIIFLLKQTKLNFVVLTLCFGILMTGFGSAYYHYCPNNQTLVWDRIPMTIIFGNFFTLFYCKYVDEKIKYPLWIFMIFIGISSVLYWYWTEIHTVGDLRLYALIQFFPMVLIIIVLVYHKGIEMKSAHSFYNILAYYAMAKLCEHFDHQIFEMTSFVSGHVLKHILASISTWWMIEYVKSDILELY